MNAAAIIALTQLVLELSSTYIKIAQKQNGELTPEQESEFRANLKQLQEEAYWKIEPDPT